jgi:undecaprenyl diphosphate synthase
LGENFVITSTLQSLNEATQPGLHVAIIMDGNGRWAASRGLPRSRGHAAGAEALHHLLQNAPDSRVRNLTVYAFSSDNWSRPAPECSALFSIMEDCLRDETRHCVKQGVELRFIGARGRLPASLQTAIADAEALTARGKRLCLRIALDYSARDALAQAVAVASQGDGWPAASLSRQTIDYALAMVYGQPGRRLPAVDLLIRTGGEHRLSDFLLWECAYAELYFTPTLWPDFNAAELGLALDWFHRRNRHFGSIPVPQSDSVSEVVGGRSC